MKKASIVLLFCLFIVLSFTANAQSNCTYTLNPTSISISGAAFSGSLSVTTQFGCNWTAISSNSWITIISGASGTGSGTVNYSVTQNSSGLSAQRTGSIIVNNQTLNITQDRYCGYRVDPTSLNFSGSGGTANFTVNAASNTCPVRLIPDVSWISISGGPGPTVPYTVTVAPNSGAARTGTVIITGVIFESALLTINQAAGQQNCTYSINPTSIQAGAAPSTTGFNITTETGCNWTAQSNANWITICNTTGSGSGRITYLIQSNNGQARTGAITVGGQTFTVNQDAFAAPVEYLMATGQIIANNRPVRDAIVTFSANGETLTARTNHSGYFRLTVQRNQSYSVTISHKRYKFSGTRSVTYNSNNLVAIFAADQE